MDTENKCAQGKRLIKWINNVPLNEPESVSIGRFDRFKSRENIVFNCTAAEMNGFRTRQESGSKINSSSTKCRKSLSLVRKLQRPPAAFAGRTKINFLLICCGHFNLLDLLSCVVTSNYKSNCTSFGFTTRGTCCCQLKQTC